MKRPLLYILILLCLMVSAANAGAAEQKPGEYQVKALFLYNFVNFIDWPADSSFRSSPAINVCIMGDDPFNGAFDVLRDETVKGKRMAIRYYPTYREPKDCHIIFIPDSESNHTAHILRSIRETGVLTVADSEESVRQGTVIGFFIEQKRVRFAINIEAAKRAGLRISAKLLRLARIVNPAEN
ncbi:MAG TPA: YfiR family protein [Geobacteraceae bacterium]